MLAWGVLKSLSGRQSCAGVRGDDKLKLEPCDQKGSGPRGSYEGFVFRDIFVGWTKS